MTARVPVPVDPLADEVVRGGVAQVDREIGNRLVEVDEAVREGMTVVRGNRGGTGNSLDHRIFTETLNFSPHVPYRSQI